MSSELKEQFQVEQIASIREIVRIISRTMALPLFLIFWIADWIYAPQLVWYFFLLRISIIPIIFVARYFLNKNISANRAQFIAMSFASYFGLTISIMMLMTEGSSSLYYAGLNLVAIGVGFLPLTMGFAIASLTLIYLPFLAMAVQSLSTQHEGNISLLHLFFVCGTGVIVTVIRMTINQLKMAELKARLELTKEINNRNKIIQEQTQEATRLRQLSRQFSPQVIKAMSSGALKLDNQVTRQKICVCFIDIVNSTSRITRIDKDQMDQVISRFMDDTIQSLLQFDITIDKFLGDGIVAFSNAPLPKYNYVDNALLGSLKVLEKIREHRSFYLSNWLQEFQVRIGLASGFANVGFYGTAEAFKTYTAIGPVMNLAARLCAAAEPNKILISSTTSTVINDPSLFRLSNTGPLRLKGFEEDMIQGVYVESALESQLDSQDDELCPKCQGPLNLQKDIKGNYFFYCDNCMGASRNAA